jgi:protein O-GlcNAc transferase
MNKADIIRNVHQMAKQGQGAAAVQQLSQVLSAYPNDPDLNEHMGLLLLGAPGALDTAIQHLQRAIQVAPAISEFRSNYATALSMRGRSAEAAQEFRRAIALKPMSFPPHIGLSSSLMAALDYDGAIMAAKEASALDASRVEPWTNMGAAMLRSGRTAEGIKSLEHSLRRFPDHPAILSLLIPHLHHSPDADPKRLRAEHEHLGRLIAAAVPPHQPFPNSKDADRPLRIGYLSPDFRAHSVTSFFRPILASHDASQFQVYCYSTAGIPDEVTAQLQAMAPNWRDVSRQPDASLESQVRADQIDIMVDLAGHTAGSRIVAMARRLAPLQASYLGYPSTTGIPAMDYRIVDALTDPPGCEQFYTEKLLRLDGCCLCYAPPENAPSPTSDIPHPTSHVTFGSFNAVQKISEPAIRAWAQILKAVPGSRLLLKTPGFDSPSARRHFSSRFNAEDIAADRLEFVGRIASSTEHLAAYSRADIALDSFPYSGATTTCESLWMGVPVVTLQGRTHAGRTGLSILSAAGLADLVAKDEHDYIARAVALASDTPRLKKLHASLRDTVRASPLCDGSAFTRKLEGAYRNIWRAWCAT